MKRILLIGFTLSLLLLAMIHLMSECGQKQDEDVREELIITLERSLEFIENQLKSLNDITTKTENDSQSFRKI
jgi:hypothetical protein